ncbi:hypothetical protein JTB14_023324 [Gonioctena quinquepunctata]|nr:hypothetical protein JTB14_023324 [Gonioctena quinquepunctata]
MCYPEYFKIRAFCSNTQDLPTASSTTAIDTYEQMEHVPHHEAVETLSRNTKLSRSTDPLTEVLMSWSNRSENRSKVNTEVNAFTPVYSNLSKEQSHAEDKLNTFTSTPKKVFTNKTMKAANHFPINMSWISKEYAKAGDELIILTSRRSPLSQKSTSHKNIGDLLKNHRYIRERNYIPQSRNQKITRISTANEANVGLNIKPYNVF